MAEFILNPTLIPVPGGKTISEYIGRVNSHDDDVSVAIMQAPSGWIEPYQTPEFDEYTIVISGSVVVEHTHGKSVINAGQAFVSHKGERVRYSTTEDTQYVSVCVPAFSPDTVNREAENLSD